MFGIGMQEILVILLIVLILFGGKKIPELMKGMGKGLRAFKEGMNEPETANPQNKQSEQTQKTDTTPNSTHTATTDKATPAHTRKETHEQPE